MNDLQKVLLNLLKEFIRVCEKHNLRYFLVGGSCLGAARHQGFIPWDDDIDVGMPREDYDKFVELSSEYEGTHYFLQTWKTDPHYNYNYAKLRDSNTTFIEDLYFMHRINHGIWIDIFPIDGMSYNKNDDPKKFAKKITYLWFQDYLSYCSQLRRKVRKRTFFKDIGLNILGGLLWPLDMFHYRRKHTERIVTKIPFAKSALAGNYFGINMKREAMPRELFEEYTKLKFEDIEVCVPKDYDKYLTNLFHDWRKLPPEEKRVTHHKNKGFSLTEGYESYMYKHRM